MDAKELADWMEVEHRKVDELVAWLRKEALALPPGDLSGWLATTREKFEHFRAHMIRHFALEEQGGYLEPVVEHRPTLSERVELLKHEHREMAKILDSLHTGITNAMPCDRLLIGDCCSRIRHLIQCIEKHEEHEHMMVTFVFNQDIGAND